MPNPSPPLFCDAHLAHRIEQAEIDLISAVNNAARERRPGGFLTPIAGGVASFAADGSPYNKVTGLGFDGVPDPNELGLIEQAFAAHGAATQVELAHLADPQVGEMLTARGYRLESFENILGRSVLGTDAPTSADLDIRSSPADEFEEWLAVMADSVAHPDTKGDPWHEEFRARSTRRRCVTVQHPASAGTPHTTAASSPEEPSSVSLTGSRSSPAPPLPRPTGATGSRTRCSPPGLPMLPRRGVTWP